MQQQELLKARMVALKAEMGYPANMSLGVKEDTTKRELEAIVDTSQSLVPENRIEYQTLKTERDLLESNLDYSESSLFRL